MDTGNRREGSGRCEASHGLLPWNLLTSGHPEILFHEGHIPTLPQDQTVPCVSNSVSTHGLPVLLATVTRPLLICMFGCVVGEIMDVVGIAVGRQTEGPPARSITEQYNKDPNEPD